ncbi:MAG: YjbQ family protein [Clostridiales bacterium]|nr:YjbQ family protein [Clostridiales bacterium]
MLREYALNTGKNSWTDVTERVKETLAESGVTDGLCLVYCPHTTAGITINENADPDVVRDLVFALDRTYPDRPEFRHMEGNSAAHLKASVIGSSVSIPVRNGRLLLGTWQGVYFCEFDGPRTRRYFVQLQEAKE